MKITQHREITELPSGQPKILQVTDFSEFLKFCHDGEIRLDKSVGFLDGAEIHFETEADNSYRLDAWDCFIVEFVGGAMVVSCARNITDYAVAQGQRASDFLGE